MFDAKSLLEALVKGAMAPSQPAPQAGQGAGGMGGLGDLLGKMMQGGQGAPQGGQGAGGLGGLGDLLGKLGQAGGGGQAGQGAPGGAGGIEDMLRKMMPGAAGGQGGAAQSPGGGGGLEEMLRKLGGAQGGQPGAAGGGGLMDILGQVLGQATQGVKEGAQRIDQSTGAGGHMRDALGKATGQSPDDMLAKLKELIEQNKVAAGAAAGGLGGLVLGTKTGRSAAASAAKLGALVMIGGLAYKAYQNYAAGKPILDAGQQPAGPGSMALVPAPTGSGFEPNAITNDTAILYIRAMIGAAAADGRIDQAEQAQIMGGLTQAGYDKQAQAFIQQEIQAPATPEQLAASVSTAHEAVQVFTAARIAVDLDTQEENDYLVDLAQRLQLDGKLVAHIDAEAARMAS